MHTQSRPAAAHGDHSHVSLLLQQRADRPRWHFAPALLALIPRAPRPLSHCLLSPCSPVCFGFAQASSLPWLQQAPAKAPAQARGSIKMPVGGTASQRGMWATKTVLILPAAERRAGEKPEPGVNINPPPPGSERGRGGTQGGPRITPGKAGTVWDTLSWRREDSSAGHLPQPSGSCDSTWGN